MYIKRLLLEYVQYTRILILLKGNEFEITLILFYQLY